MTQPDDEDTRSIAEDGTQTGAQGSPTAGRTSGPQPSVGGEQQPGGPVPPYEGRRESADIDEGGSYRDGANVGGATGPRTTEQPPDEQSGRTGAPADAPASETEKADYPADPGVGPAHQPGVRTAEDEPDRP
jgi:hypothetical protein